MLQASANTRQRIWLLLIPIAVTLGMWTIFSVYDQWTASSPRVDSSVSLPDLKAERQLLRALDQALVALGKKGDWPAVLQATDSLGEDSGFLRLRLLRAEALLRTGQMPAAADELRGILGGPSPVVAADLLAIRGDRAGYIAHCRKLLDGKAGGSQDALEANNVSWATVILPGALPDYAEPLALARRAVSDARDPGTKATYLNTLGAALYRAGQYPEAIRILTESERLKIEPFNWPFLAMAYQKTKDTAKAKPWAVRLRQHLDDTLGQFSSQSNRHELLLFSREMDATVSH